MTFSTGYWQGGLPGFGGLSPVNSNVLLPNLPATAIDASGTEIVGQESLATTTPFVVARRSVDGASSLNLCESDWRNALHKPCSPESSHEQRQRSAVISDLLVALWLGFVNRGST